MNIEELKTEEQKLLQLLSENRAKQAEINIKKLIDKYGINVGDTIDLHGKTSKITSVRNGTYFYRNIKKDGELSLVESKVWSFDLDKLKKINN